MDNAEERVSKFYNTVGWEQDGEITEDAKRFEDLRECAREYVSKCRLRVLRYIPENGENILDMASGPIQYKEYVEYSKHFSKRYCVDLSSEALKNAKKKIADHGVYLHGSFFTIPFDENFFDCSISLHTIYHMDKDEQNEAVRKLLYVTKPGKPVIIVYVNPDTLIKKIIKLKHFLKRTKKNEDSMDPSSLYFHPHPIKWWNQFNDTATVNIVPWRSLGTDIMKKLIPDNKTGKKLLEILFNLEERYSKLFVKYFEYPMIILTKNT